MCVIAICEKRRLNKEEFKNCWESNSHGMGYAYWDGQNVYMKKGFMGKKKAWIEYQTVPLPHIVHFRIASAGEVCPELTHPFICTNRSGLMLDYVSQRPVLFHNGTVGNYKELLIASIFQTKQIPKGQMSDSRAMAIAVSVVGKDLLTMYNSQKWVYVEKNGFTKYGDWIEGEDGILYSNTSFKRMSWYGKAFGEEDDDKYYQGKFNWRNGAVIINKGQKCSNCHYLDGDICLLKDRTVVNDIACGEWEEDTREVGAGIDENGNIEENFLDRLQTLKH